jgi:hypothetical protein
LYPKDIVSGGTGVYYSADNIFIVGRQQEKDGKDITGYNFIINVEKSRYVKEKSKIPLNVTWDSGISKWSGLMDMALDSGHVTKPSQGWYQRSGDETKYRFKDTNNKDFWLPILTDETFSEWIKNKYSISGTGMFTEDISEEDIDKAYEAL